MPEALSMARELDLDLVEVADKANPPVVRIMDYGKFKYESAQRDKESRKKSSQQSVKEMKYRPKIGVGDFETKTRKVEGFLMEGHKVKITIMFRGREVTHPQLGRKILDDIAERTDGIAKVEAYPRLDGRNMTMVLGPDSKKQAAKARQEKEAAKEAAREAAAADEPVSAPEEVATDPVAETAPVTEVVEQPEAVAEVVEVEEVEPVADAATETVADEE